MRRIAAVLALAVAAILVVDFAAPAVIALEPGSVGIEPQTVDLELLAFDPEWDDPECEEPDGTDDAPCPRRYAFRAGATLTVWFSVVNTGPASINLLGVSDAWLEQFRDVLPFARPTVALDGGDPHVPGTLAEIVGKPFSPVTLPPNDERLIGVQFVVTDNLRHACEHSLGGAGIGWDSAPVAWSLLGFEHEQEMAFGSPVTFMAPIAEDCA